MTIRELQADFETVTAVVDGASTENRPDAISTDPLRAFAPGPVAVEDMSAGLLRWAWYARVEDGSVYLARSNPSRTGWEAEAELFTFAGADWTEIDLAFDGEGRPVVSGIRAGVLWIRFWNGAAYELTEFSAARSQVALQVEPAGDREVAVFYVTAGTLVYRLLSESFATANTSSVAVSANAYLVGRFRGRDHRVHLIQAVRTPADGTWSAPSRISSEPFDVPADDELGPLAAAVSGSVVSVLQEYGALLERVRPAASGVAGSFTVTMFDVEAALEELAPAASGVSGVLEVADENPVQDGLVHEHDARDLGALYDDAETVTVWPDRIGDMDLTLVSSDPAYDEDGIAGGPSVHFDGNDLFAMALEEAQDLFAGGPWTAVIVFLQGTPGTTALFGATGGGTNIALHVRMNGNDGSARLGYWFNDLNAPAGSFFTNAQARPNVAVLCQTTTGRYIRGKGVQVASDSNTTMLGAATAYRIATAASSTGFTGRIAYMAWYNRGITPAEAAAVEAWVADSFGFELAA